MFSNWIQALEKVNEISKTNVHMSPTLFQMWCISNGKDQTETTFSIWNWKFQPDQTWFLSKAMLIRFAQIWSGLIRLKNLNFKLRFFSVNFSWIMCISTVIVFNTIWFQIAFWFKLFRLFLAFFLVGPKKAMKSLKSGMGKPAMKSDLGKAVKKKWENQRQRSKSWQQENTLNKTNLKKLGPMSLDDKIQAAAESGGTVEEQAEVLKDSLTKVEHAKVWARHQTHLNKTPLEKGKLEEEKGVKAAEWLMRTAGKKYLRCSRKVTASESLEKDNTWKSEKSVWSWWVEGTLWLCQRGLESRQTPTLQMFASIRIPKHGRDPWLWAEAANGRNERSKNAGKVGSRHRCFSRVASQSCLCLAMTVSFRLRIWVSVQFPTRVRWITLGPDWRERLPNSWMGRQACGLSQWLVCPHMRPCQRFLRHEMYYCRFCASDVAVPGLIDSLLVFRGKW